MGDTGRFNMETGKAQTNYLSKIIAVRRFPVKVFHNKRQFLLIDVGMVGPERIHYIFKFILSESDTLIKYDTPEYFLNSMVMA
jgi:hypothetical protein